MTYDDLVRLVNSMPRVPKRELRCHPLVIDYLRWDCRYHPVHRDPLAKIYDLWACPVTVVSIMEPGAWEFYEDDVLVRAGNTERHE